MRPRNSAIELQPAAELHLDVTGAALVDNGVGDRGAVDGDRSTVGTDVAEFVARHLLAWIAVTAARDLEPFADASRSTFTVRSESCEPANWPAESHDAFLVHAWSLDMSVPWRVYDEPASTQSPALVSVYWTVNTIESSRV
jgi:hypothetical protein